MPAGWPISTAYLLPAPDGTEAPISHAEAELLRMFLDNPRRPISGAQMLGTPGGAGGESFDRAIDVRISRLRTKLGEDPRNPRLIKTICGAGDIFLAQPGQGRHCGLRRARRGLSCPPCKGGPPGRGSRRGAGMQPSVHLQAIDISFALPGRAPFHAVRGADLRVEPGQFVSIVGPTGCGKSTLLNAAAGLIRPSAGEVRIEGAPLSGLNRSAGYLFQADALMPWKTAGDNVAIGLEAAGTPRREALARAHDWLARVGLRGHADRYPHMLSGGQRKRVALAQVLIRDPAILLMDEPFGPLDAQTRLIMHELLLRLWSENRKAVMFVTHDLEEAIALSDRVVIMSAGPAARIIGDFPIPLPRPRDIAEIRLSAGFLDLHRSIWGLLRDQVMAAYGTAPQAGARA